MTVPPPGYETWSEVRQRAAKTWPTASGPKLLGYLVTGELQAWESDAGCNVKPVSADSWKREEWRRLCLARPNDLSSRDKQPVLKTEDLRKLMPTSNEMLDEGNERHRAKREAALAAAVNRDVPPNPGKLGGNGDNIQSAVSPDEAPASREGDAEEKRLGRQDSNLRPVGTPRIKGDRILAEMREMDISELRRMIEKDMEHRFKAARSTCRNYRKRVLAENGDN